jgi:hypothetical protein
MFGDEGREKRFDFAFYANPIRRRRRGSGSSCTTAGV